MPDLNSDDFLGYIKYDGGLVADGVIDARAAATALEGFDSALRYFVTQKHPELATVEYPIPVRIQSGSWLAIIPNTVGEWMLAGAGVVITTYLSTAAKKVAENDFKEATIRDLLRKALHAIQWFIRIGNHLGTLAERSLKNLRWRENNTEVGIPNEQGEILFVPREYLELFLEAPTGLLSRIAEVIETERTLSIGRNANGKIEEVTITQREKHIFYVPEADDSEVLFPELAHGQPVKLEGVVTRGNETANSIGFKFRDHILTGYPRKGSIVRFKPHLFLRCIIVGEISRSDDRGSVSDPRPKIIFDDLQTIEPESPELFAKA